MPYKITYPKIEFATNTISQKCYKKVKEIYGERLPKEIEERLKLELHSIEINNFASIYLISSELVDYSKKLGYKVGCRGSVGNSFVAYLLGITDINPIQYNLPFEFFAGKDYAKEPDINLTFSRKIQEKIFTYLQKKYGKDKIICGGTIETLTGKIIEESYNEYVDILGIKNTSDKETIIGKLFEVKKCTGENLDGVFITSEESEILNFCPTEIGNKGHIKTHYDYHTLWNLGLYKFDLLSNDDLSLIHELEKETKINSKNIDLNDKETLKMFLHANDKSYPISAKGIPEFGTPFVQKMIETTKPSNFNDLVCISALFHGTGTWNNNASFLIENEHKRVDEVISNRADMFNYLVNYGIEKSTAFDIVEFIRKGRVNLWTHNQNRYREMNIKWKEYKTLLKKHNIPEWYIESAEKIKYMFPKAHAIGCTMNAFRIAWFKVHYPKAFYKAYLKIKTDLNIKNYYYKNQVQTELNRLYENNENFESTSENDDKIRNLELVMEMFNRGILKERSK